MTVPKAALTYPNTGKMALGPVRAAWPTAAVNINAAAMSNNWIFGRGTPIGMGGGHWWRGAGAQSKTLRFYGQVDDNHLVVALAIVMCATERLTGLDVLVTLPGGLTAEISLNETPSLYQFALTQLAGNTDQSYAITLAWDGDVAGLAVFNTYLYECPAVRLPPDTGTVSIVPRQQIYDEYDGDHVSIGGLARAVEQQRLTYFRRGVLYGWESGAAGPWDVTSTAYVMLHPDGALPAIQTRLMYLGETVRPCYVNAYGVATVADANVRVTMANGDTVTFTITAGFTGWQFPVLIDVETDDPARWPADGGLRGGTRDTVTIEAKCGAGGTFALHALSIWDPSGNP